MEGGGKSVFDGAVVSSDILSARLSFVKNNSFETVSVEFDLCHLEVRNLESGLIMFAVVSVIVQDAESMVKITRYIRGLLYSDQQGIYLDDNFVANIRKPSPS